MKFAIMFQLQTPRPLDADQWHEHDELKIYHEALEQIEFADKLGYDYVFITEHHLSEAAAYFEYTLDMAMRVQRL